MGLEPGAKLGQYEILGSLGAGGMGEVYRARDSRLGREVAIKVLPSEVARDAERLARFRREPTLLADPLGAPGSWSPAGELLFETWGDHGTGYDIWAVGDDGAAEPWLASPYHESQPELSPDGRWLAYSSTEAGEWDIYVAPYPGGGRGRRVPQGGGLAPVWSRDGRELFYRDGRMLMKVTWTEAPRSVPRPSPVFEDRFWLGSILHMERNYDVAPDGRFLMLEPVDDDVDPAHVVVVQSWFEELRAASRVEP